MLKYSEYSPNNGSIGSQVGSKIDYPYIKVSVCVNRRISLTAEPIWFSFTMKLHIGPGGFYNCFGGDYQQPPKRKGVIRVFSVMVCVTV